MFYVLNELGDILSIFSQAHPVTPIFTASALSRFTVATTVKRCLQCELEVSLWTHLSTLLRLFLLVWSQFYKSVFGRNLRTKPN
jgi:hypothetical protein